MSSRKPSPPSFTRRQALQMGLGIGATIAAGEGCGAVRDRCAAGPIDRATGALRAIETIVVVMMENRSFDNLLGALRLDATYPGAAAVGGLSGQETCPDELGRPMGLTRMNGNGSGDPKHDWMSSQLAFNDGRNDGFVRINTGASRTEAMGYYDRARLPFLYALADESVVCDHWFSSFMGPTWPNRFYLHATTAGGRTTNLPMGLAAPPTIWDAMAQRCWRAKNYYGGAFPWYSAAFPSKSFSGDDAMTPEPVDHFYKDAARGELPHFALIDPDFRVNDGHPPHDLALAEAFLASIYRALAESPQWPSSLLVVLFDEHGGFFDHLPPPPVNDPNPSFRRLGFRVPAIVAGPRVRRGAVVSTVFDHVSIAATLAARYGIASLGPRMDEAADLGACLDDTGAGTPETAAAVAAVRLPRVDLSASRSLAAPVRASSQPELESLAASGGIPAAHIDPRPAGERVQAWLRHAQELEAVRVIQ